MVLLKPTTVFWLSSWVYDEYDGHDGHGGLLNRSVRCKQLGIVAHNTFHFNATHFNIVIK